MYMCFASTSTHMIYTLSLHDALPICCGDRFARRTNSILGRLLSLALLIFLGVCSLFFGQQLCHSGLWRGSPAIKLADVGARSEEHTSELQSRRDLVCRLLLEKKNKRK